MTQKCILNTTLAAAIPAAVPSAGAVAATSPALAGAFLAALTVPGDAASAATSAMLAARLTLQAAVVEGAKPVWGSACHLDVRLPSTGTSGATVAIARRPGATAFADGSATPVPSVVAEMGHLVALVQQPARNSKQQTAAAPLALWCAHTTAASIQPILSAGVEDPDASVGSAGATPVNTRAMVAALPALTQLPASYGTGVVCCHPELAAPASASAGDNRAPTRAVVSLRAEQRRLQSVDVRGTAAALEVEGEGPLAEEDFYVARTFLAGRFSASVMAAALDSFVAGIDGSGAASFTPELRGSAFAAASEQRRQGVVVETVRAGVEALLDALPDRGCSARSVAAAERARAARSRGAARRRAYSGDSDMMSDENDDLDAAGDDDDDAELAERDADKALAAVRLCWQAFIGHCIRHWESEQRALGLVMASGGGCIVVRRCGVSLLRPTDAVEAVALRALTTFVERDGSGTAAAPTLGVITAAPSGRDFGGFFSVEADEYDDDNEDGMDDDDDAEAEEMGGAAGRRLTVQDQADEVLGVAAAVAALLPAAVRATLDSGPSTAAIQANVLLVAKQYVTRQPVCVHLPQSACV